MDFREKIIEYRKEAPSVASLSTKTDLYFLEKYGNRGEGGTFKYNGVLYPGSIYFFNYNTDSKITDKVKFIDRNPLVLYISSERVNQELIVKCIDLTITPPDQRVEILQRLYEKFSGILENNEKKTFKGESPDPILLNSKDLPQIFKDTGYKFSFTGFKFKYMEQVKFVDYSDWYKLPYLKYSLVQGMSINEIYNDYRSKLKE
jgi:hypothetical protein